MIVDQMEEEGILMNAVLQTITNTIINYDINIVEPPEGTRDMFAYTGYKLLKALKSIHPDLEKTILDWAISIGTGRASFFLLFIGFIAFETRLEYIDNPRATKILGTIEAIFVGFMFVLFAIYAAYNNGVLPK